MSTTVPLSTTLENLELHPGDQITVEDVIDDNLRLSISASKTVKSEGGKSRWASKWAGKFEVLTGQKGNSRLDYLVSKHVK